MLEGTDLEKGGLGDVGILGGPGRRGCGRQSHSDPSPEEGRGDRTLR